MNFSFDEIFYSKMNKSEFLEYIKTNNMSGLKISFKEGAEKGLIMLFNGDNTERFFRNFHISSKYMTTKKKYEVALATTNSSVREKYMRDFVEGGILMQKMEMDKKETQDNISELQNRANEFKEMLRNVKHPETCPKFKSQEELESWLADQPKNVADDVKRYISTSAYLVEEIQSLNKKSNDELESGRAKLEAKYGESVNKLYSKKINFETDLNRELKLVHDKHRPVLDKEYDPIKKDDLDRENFQKGILTSITDEIFNKSMKIVLV